MSLEQHWAPSGQSCYTYLHCSHSWLCQRLPREKSGKQTAWKELAAACSSPQPQDSHKVLLQWECVFGSFLPGCSFSLLVWHHLPHSHFSSAIYRKNSLPGLVASVTPIPRVRDGERSHSLPLHYSPVKQGMTYAARSRRQLLKCHKHLEYD